MLWHAWWTCIGLLHGGEQLRTTGAPSCINMALVALLGARSLVRATDVGARGARHQGGDVRPCAGKAPDTCAKPGQRAPASHGQSAVGGSQPAEVQASAFADAAVALPARPPARPPAAPPRAQDPEPDRGADAPRQPEPVDASCRAPAPGGCSPPPAPAGASVEVWHCSAAAAATEAARSGSGCPLTEQGSAEVIVRSPPDAPCAEERLRAVYALNALDRSVDPCVGARARPCAPARPLTRGVTCGRPARGVRADTARPLPRHPCENARACAPVRARSADPSALAKELLGG